jgi:hypothetical protein
VMCWKSIFLGIKTGSWFSGKKWLFLHVGSKM